MDIRVVFMGSPEFALPALRGLSAGYEVAGVVTQPDRRAGRGRKLTPPPVKELAIELGLPTIQPARVRDPEPMAQLESWAPDVIVVAAYGQILRPNLLDLPPHGCVNIHGSLLPRWRGAAPIQAAILHGDDETGVTIMRMDPGMDTGPILSQRVMKIQPEDTAGSLSERMADAGAALLLETLPDYLSGRIEPQEQSESGVTMAPLLTKSDGLLDFNRPAVDLERQVRAFQPWPGAFFQWRGNNMKVIKATLAKNSGASQKTGIGKPLVIDGQPAIQTSEGALVLLEVQPAGKRAMPGKAFLQGAQDWQT